MNPLVKWAGGKRRLVKKIIPILGDDFKHYYEPFLGGGSVLLELLPKHATGFDINEELINLYNIVKESPNELIDEYFENFVAFHSHDFYYCVRNWDRDPEFFQIKSKITKAARLLYLNKTCYNGLWRENSKGQFNVPLGKYKTPSFTTKECILEASQYFSNNDIIFERQDYKHIEEIAVERDLVYFDPPYDVEKNKNSFVSYSKSGFDSNDQKELRDLCIRLIRRGVKVAISNSGTDLIRNLYSDKIFSIHEMNIQYSVGGNKERREPKMELLITGNL